MKKFFAIALLAVISASFVTTVGCTKKEEAPVEQSAPAEEPVMEEAAAPAMEEAATTEAPAADGTAAPAAEGTEAPAATETPAEGQ